jgi:hypothetical protein
MAKKQTDWLHEMVCVSCRHFSRLDDSEQIPKEDVLGECLRYPPHVIGLTENEEVIQGLPIVEARHKCGEWGGVIN